MKPKKLIMSAFGPYKDTVEIDFDKFGNGIFLITGDTGAGKTTIFDGISYALYGDTSGDNRDAKSLRSNFAPDGAETYVKLEFEHKGEIYEIERNPEYMAAKKRGTGYTKKEAYAVLKTPERTVTGMKPVTKEVVSLLGVDYSQFKQSAMIAQGEFLRLLLAKSDERSEIFRKVFDTAIYQNIRIELNEMKNRMDKELEDSKKELRSLASKVKGNDDSEEFSSIRELLKEKNDHLNSDNILKLLEVIINEYEDAKNRLAEDDTRLSAEIDRITREYENAKNINTLIESLDADRLKLEQLQKKGEEINIAKAELKKNKKATREIKPLYDAYERIGGVCSQLEASVAEQKKKLCIYEKQKKTAEENLRQLEAEEPERETLSASIKHIAESLEKYSALEEIRKHFSDISIKYENTKKSEEESIILCKEYEEKLSSLEAKIESFKDAELEKAGLENDLEKLCTTKDRLSELKSCLTECIALEKNLKDVQNAFKLLTEKYDSARTDYDKKEKLFFANQAGLLAEMLIENEPCPVCGSLHHPKKAQVSENAPGEQELETAKQTFEDVRSKWQDKSGECREAEVKYTEKSELLNQKAVELKLTAVSEDVINQRISENAKEINAKEADISSAKDSIAKRKQLEAELSDIRKFSEDNNSKLEQYRKELSEYETELAESRTRLNMIKETLKFESRAAAEAKMQAFENTLAAMKTELNTASDEYKKISENIASTAAIIETDSQKLESEQAEYRKADEAFVHAVSNSYFADSNEAMSYVLDEADISKKEEEIADYNRILSEIKAVVEKMEKEVAGKEKQNLTELAEIQAAAREKLASVQKDRMETEHVLRTDKSVFEDITNLKKEKAEKEKRYSAVSELAKTASGISLESGNQQQRISFEQYVQSVYFDMVLNAANERLEKMTMGRYYMLRKEDGTDQRSSSGLEIDVVCRWTNKKRSVSTLSGGESFKASLALALGLSDVVQRRAGGIRFDTMFIDEGFGSLDGESREQAVEVLAELSEGNRLIGIISHVDELKSRISKKIIVNKSREGSNLKLEGI